VHDCVPEIWFILVSSYVGTHTLSTDEPPTQAPPDTPNEEPPSNDNGNRARNDEAPGQNSSNDAPGSRRDETQSQQNNNNGNANANSNGKGR
jgi:hypothetical protein